MTAAAGTTSATSRARSTVMPPMATAMGMPAASAITRRFAKGGDADRRIGVDLGRGGVDEAAIRYVGRARGERDRELLRRYASRSRHRGAARSGAQSSTGTSSCPMWTRSHPASVARSGRSLATSGMRARWQTGSAERTKEREDLARRDAFGANLKRTGSGGEHGAGELERIQPGGARALASTMA